MLNSWAAALQSLCFEKLEYIIEVMPSKKPGKLTLGSSLNPLELIDKIKRLALTGMVADDELMRMLVLKGGNALSLIYGLNNRASFDLDFSMEGDFPAEIKEHLLERVTASLEKVFKPQDLMLFDIKVEEEPREMTPDLKEFWGGYKISFKLIENARASLLRGSLDDARRQAIVVAQAQHRTFEIQISRHEWCQGRKRKEVSGYQVNVYSPLMLICEKLRAICQQDEGYCRFVKKAARPRARDFFDIHTLVQRYPVDSADPELAEILLNTFKAKRVPLGLLGGIKAVRAFHAADWASVKEAVPATSTVQEFDYYFDFVVALCGRLEPLWIEDPPSA